MECIVVHGMETLLVNAKMDGGVSIAMVCKVPPNFFLDVNRTCYMQYVRWTLLAKGSLSRVVLWWMTLV